jgi:hypothetical protein
MKNQRPMKKCSISLLSLLFLSFVASCQDTLIAPKTNFDVAFTFMGQEIRDNRNFPRFKIEIRKAKHNRNWLKASISATGSYQHRESTNISRTDSLFEERHLGYRNTRVYGQLGLDRTIGEKELFFIGGGMILGYELSHGHYSTIGEMWSQDLNEWIPIEYDNSNFSTEIENLPAQVDLSRSGDHWQSYAIAGLELNFGINASISNRFQIGLQASPQLIVGKQINQRVDDPENIFTESLNISRFNGYLDLSLRYRFGGFKS